MRNLVRCHSILLVLFSSLLAGSALAREVPQGWPWHGVSMGVLSATPDGVARFKKNLGVNVIRLQLKSRHYAVRNKASADEARKHTFEWADSMLDECAKHGVKAIINVSHFPVDSSKSNQRTEMFWEDPKQIEEVKREVARTIEHFKNRGNELIAYDFMSEPVLKSGGKVIQPPKWPALLADIIEVIRKSDPDRWLIIAPGPWGGPTGYRDFQLPSYTKLILGVHMYAPHKFTHQGSKRYGYPGLIGLKTWDKNTIREYFEPLRDVAVKNNLPVLVGEFSAVRWAEGGERYIKELASIFEEYGWSWLYFSATGWHGWNPDYNQHYPGKDKGGNWRKDYVGERSVRWETLREIFGVKQGIEKP